MLDKKQTKVKVVIRVRPKLKDLSTSCVITNNAANTIEILNHRNIRENLLYDFSSVYDETCSQQYIYNNSIKNLLTKPLNGENISIFAYGPTGAGKTHTMLGSAMDPGMIPRVINGTLQLISKEKNTAEDKPEQERWQYTVTFSYLEIYNEKVQDLLEPASVDLPIREDGDHNIFVTGLAEKEIQSFDDFKNYFGPASNNRTVAVTKLNDRSSRSHSILMLKIRKTSMFPPNREYHGKIYLIDLAGSEDNRRTGNQGIRLKESGAINRSLFVLGEVVDAINNNQPRIPYRNSKLTRLLQDSIGGSCHSVMITNIAPEESYYYDTYCTLNFASKSKKIVNTNTTCLKQQNSGGSGDNFLKRKNSSKLKADNGKRPKLAPSPMISEEAPVSTDPAPLLSPLMRRQNNLENTVNQRLQEMEQNILRQLKQNNAENNNSAMAEIQRQLMICREELQRMKEIKDNPKVPTDKITKKQESKCIGNKESKKTKSKTKVILPVNDVNDEIIQKVKTKGKSPDENKTKTEVNSKSPVVDENDNSSNDLMKTQPALLGIKDRKGLQDKTNQTNVDKEKSNKAKVLKIKEKLEIISCSPLFATVPRIFKKGFKSTACKRIFEDDEDDDEEIKTIPKGLNPGVQNQHNVDFLKILNTASVKALQQLHTVGNKRARLIYDWRQLHGEFETVDGLMDIPTLTEKYIKNLLHSNMVTS